MLVLLNYKSEKSISLSLYFEYRMDSYLKSILKKFYKKIINFYLEIIKNKKLYFCNLYFIFPKNDIILLKKIVKVNYW